MDSTTPLDTSCQAEYEDGFILDETENEDVSLWAEGKNTFYDILNGLPETEHGHMVRFSVFWRGKRYDVNWRGIPGNGRPIRFRHGFVTRSVDGTFIRSGWSGMDFGYQWNDDEGGNHQEVQELR